jgi:hypothetical protein
MTRARLSLSFILAGLTLGAVMTLGLLHQSARAGSTTYRVDSTAILASAESDAPYEIVQPTWLPDGIALDAVMPTDASEATPDIYSLDLFYRDASGNAVHVWETNISDLAALGKDPVAAGLPVVLEGQTWSATTRSLGQTVSILSRRFAGGITVSVDSNLNSTTLSRIAASIH